MTYRYLLLDMETLDNRPSSVVLDIAAAVFDLEHTDNFTDLVNDADRLFHVKLSVEDQIKNYDRTIGKETVEWWANQNETARQIIKPTTKDLSMKDALIAFQEFLKKHKFDNECIGYCRSQSFDFPIAVSMMDDVFPGDPENSNFPVGFWNQRDVRTAIAHDLINPKNTKCPLPKGLLKDFTPHNSIHDVCRDVISLQYAWAYKTGAKELPDEYDIY